MVNIYVIMMKHNQNYLLSRDALVMIYLLNPVLCKFELRILRYYYQVSPNSNILQIARIRTVAVLFSVGTVVHVIVCKL